MASSLLALLDDIATILDDVAVLSKVAAKKTAGVLGDDLALNAQQVAGLHADRELPVVWAVAKGSAVNKAILVPAALAISALAPWAVTPLLMVGGAYLCFEGFEKLAHKFLHNAADERARHAALTQALADPEVDLVQLEAGKVKGAIRTDFILSAEIVVISLGTVASSPFITQVGVVAGIAVLMTVGVYGLVAGIVKLDDAGLYLSRKAGAAAAFGRVIVRIAPWLMKALAIVGTAAMFLVGGGILVHGVPALHHAIEALSAGVTAWPGVGAPLGWITPLLLDGLVGVLAGAVVLAAVMLFQRVRGVAWGRLRHRSLWVRSGRRAQRVQRAIQEIEPVLPPEAFAVEDEGGRAEHARGHGVVGVALVDRLHFGRVFGRHQRGAIHVVFLGNRRRTSASAVSRSSAQSARSSACDRRNASRPRSCAAITIQPGRLFQSGSVTTHG